MRIGKLSQRIAFERSTAASSEAAAVSQTWAEFASCWAWVMSLDGQELNEANKLVGKHNWKIRTRYRADITIKDRIVYGDKYLYISSISHDSSMSEVTEFLCTETPSA